MSDDFGLWEVIVSTFWFMVLLAWIWLFISILADIFRDKELGGGAKALWVILLILLPWLGALVYLIARGGSMHERSAKQAQQSEAAFRAYVQDAATTSAASPADELAKLASLRDDGTLTTDEYEKAKAKILN